MILHRDPWRLATWPDSSESRHEAYPRPSTFLGFEPSMLLKKMSYHLISPLLSHIFLGDGCFFTHSLSISTGFTRFVDSSTFLDHDPRPEKYLAAGHGAQDLQRQGPQAALGAGVDGGTAEDDVPRNRGHGHGLPQLQHLGHTMARMVPDGGKGWIYGEQSCVYIVKFKWNYILI